MDCSTAWIRKVWWIYAKSKIDKRTALKTRSLFALPYIIYLVALFKDYTMVLTIFLKGILIGFAVAVPIGPIGIMCIRKTLAEGPVTRIDYWPWSRNCRFLLWLCCCIRNYNHFWYTCQPANMDTAGRWSTSSLSWSKNIS